ncbi:MAG: MBOAT family protein [Acidobacteria bacterium]|nr:MBOAT family protein [Acidobacteriota bacterium]MCI0724749.1 MBOAT family protein [Acidobacteriota bacterium]
MLFNSFHYVLFFIAVLIATDAIRRRNFQHTFLLIASYYFYWAFSSHYVLLVVISTLTDFYCGKAIFRATDPRTKKFFLSLSLAAQLGLLGYFKYTNFAIDSAKAALESLGVLTGLHHLDIVLPVGISFYTFMSLSYTLDIYFGRFQPIDSLRTFALYLTFFPHLVAGPILRASEFLPQLRSTLVLTWKNFRLGFTLILYGLIKKIVFADNLSGFVQETFAGELTQDSLIIFFAIVAFAIQIYCDFSGYTDIAIGSAKVLGLTFPGNFAHPYFSRNISEFWQRWHMSLSRWLRDYLYIPLGGNRKGKPRQYVNLLTTMALGGLWHGASWNFLIWGLYQGLFLAAHKSLLAERTFMTSRLWDPFKILFTFYVTCIGWLIFILSDLDKLVFYLKKMLFWEFTPSSLDSFVEAHPQVVLIMIVFFIVHTISYWAGDLSRVFAGLRVPAWATYLLISAVFLYLFAAGQQASFIYFQF